MSRYVFIAETNRVPRTCSPLSGESTWNPGILRSLKSVPAIRNSRSHQKEANLVSVVPDGNPNAPRDRVARRNDSFIVLLLLRIQRRRGRQRHTDVELRDRDLDAQGRELLHVGDKRRRDFAHN